MGNIIWRVVNLGKNLIILWYLNNGVKWAQQNKDISQKSLESWNEKTEEEKSAITSKRLEFWNKMTEEDLGKLNQKKFETIESKYGSVSLMYKEIQNKIKETSKSKYGVDHFLMSPHVINKRVDSYKSKIIQKYLKRIPSGYYLNTTEYNSNNTDTYLYISHKKCNKDFKVTRQLFNKRINENEELCLECNPISNGYSKMEKDILEIVKDNYNGEGNILENDKSLGIELDIFLPLEKIAIEVLNRFLNNITLPT